MQKRPDYDLIFIIPFSAIGLLCYWSIFWNSVVFDVPMDMWGITVGLVGTLSFGAVINYTLAIRRLKKEFVWETLKNG